MSDFDPPSTEAGSCLCKAVNYTLSGVRLTRVICACDNCQRMSGSVFSSIRHYKDATLTLESGADVIKKYEDSNTKSGNTTERWFCGNCGSQLYGFSPTFKLYILRAGCMNNEEEKIAKPMAASFTERVPTWIEKLGVMADYPAVVAYFMSLAKSPKLHGQSE